MKKKDLQKSGRHRLYIFNPSEGVREYDAREFDAASCRANTQVASFICSGTVFPDMNTASKAFNYVRRMSKRGGNTVVTVLGTVLKSKVRRHKFL